METIALGIVGRSVGRSRSVIEGNLAFAEALPTDEAGSFWLVGLLGLNLVLECEKGGGACGR